MEIRVWRYFDPVLLLAMVALVAYGLAMIYSATYERTGIGIDPLVFRAAIYAAIGLVLFATLSAVDYHVLRNLAWLFYLGSVGLLTQAITTVILGWLLLSEPVKPLQGLGAGLILAGIALAALAPPMPRVESA